MLSPACSPGKHRGTSRISLRIRHFRLRVGSLEILLVLREQGFDPVELKLDRGKVIRMSRHVEEKRGHCLGINLESVMTDVAQGIRFHLVGVVWSVRGIGGKSESGYRTRDTPGLLETLGLARFLGYSARSILLHVCESHFGKRSH